MAHVLELEALMPKPKRNDVPVKVDADVIADARIVAAYEHVSLAAYLSERLRPLVAEDLARHQAEHKPQRKPKAPPAKE